MTSSHCNDVINTLLLLSLTRNEIKKHYQKLQLFKNLNFKQCKKKSDPSDKALLFIMSNHFKMRF